MKMQCVCLSFVIWLLGVASLEAQVVTGAITGRVTDTTGAVVPGTAVEMRNIETGLTRTVATDPGGRYAARNLPLGTYSITAQQTGFATAVRSGITLTVGSEVVVNLELQVGAVAERIEILGEAPQIESTTATMSDLVDNKQMRDLPLNSRSYEHLALLSAGVVNVTNTQRNASQGSGLGMSVHGARLSMNLYLLDGTVVNDGSGQGPGSAANQNMGVEAIREFRVLTHNFSAEYGRNAGGVITAVTRSGTNDFHGSVYEFLRNDIFDARDFFQVGEIPPYRRNQFGGALGGPLRRDRLFFFANYEAMRERRVGPQTGTVPDANARQGLIPDPATGQLREVPLNPIAKPYLNLYPLPNGINFGDGTARFIRDVSVPTNDDYFMGRVDFRVSDQDSFYGRYIFNPSDSLSPQFTPGFGTSTEGKSQFAVLSHLHVFSGASLNEIRFAFNRTVPAQLPVYGENRPDASLSFIPGQELGLIGFTTGQVGGGAQLSGIGASRTIPGIFTQNLFQVTDNFSIIKGAHALKFGFDLERIQLNPWLAFETLGIYTFGGLLSLMAAQPIEFRAQIVDNEGNPMRGYRRIRFGWFVQDDIRVSPRLTLNLGFRHEFFTNVREVNGRTANLRNNTDPRSTIGPAFLVPYTDFSPRVGLAWDPTGSGKTAIRAGTGIFQNFIEGRAYYFQTLQDHNFFKSVRIQNPPFPYGLSGGLSGLQLNTQGVEFNTKTPTIVHWSAEIQRELVPTVSLHVGYVGSHGYNLAGLSQEAIGIPEIRPDGSKFWPAVGPKLNPIFTKIEYLRTKYRSNYHGLQVTLQKALSHGFQLGTSYTWSKVLADFDQQTTGEGGAAAGSVLDFQDIDRDYSRAVFDQRHTFVLNSRYQMPWDNLLSSGVAKAVLGGWAINGILRAGSGTAFTILAGFNNSRNGDVQQPDRPDLAPGFSNNPIKGTTAGCPGIQAGQKLGTPDRWFDPCAFDLPPAGTLGNLARNTVTAPPVFNLDFGLMKNTPLYSERMNLEFRAEIFNIMNHPEFATPNRGTFTSRRARVGSSGVISSTANNSREIQFGLKLTF